MTSDEPRDPQLDKFVRILEDEHHCHTILLYGSRATGTHSPSSDYDMLGIRREGEDSRDARFVDGHFLDAFIRTEKTIADGPHGFLHVRGAIVLRDPHGMGARLLADVASALQSPPPEAPAAEIEARRVWCTKMLGRIRNAAPDELEAHYRRHWLLVDLLEFYFILRRRHYLGSKESFRWLKENDESAHAAFAKALVPDANADAIAQLVDAVVRI